MSETGTGPPDWNAEVIESPVTVRRETTDRPDGQILTYRLRTDAEQPTAVRFRQPVPSGPTVSDVGFRLDAAPEEWTAADGVVEALACVDPEAPMELVLGFTFAEAGGSAGRPPEPVVLSVERTTEATDRRAGSWESTPRGADQEALRSAIESVDLVDGPGGNAGTDAEAADSDHGFDFAGPPGEGEEPLDADTGEDSAGGAETTAGTGVPEERGTTDPAEATVAELREAVAERNEALMELRAELAVARSERADLRETVRELRERVDALADGECGDGPVHDGSAGDPGGDR